jgi:hypothetical protein
MRTVMTGALLSVYALAANKSSARGGIGRRRQAACFIGELCESRRRRMSCALPRFSRP